MAITLRGSDDKGAASSSSSPSYQLTLPGSAVEGDIAVGMLGCKSSIYNVTACTPLSGGTTLGGRSVSSSQDYFRLSYKVLTATDISNGYVAGGYSLAGSNNSVYYAVFEVFGNAQVPVDFNYPLYTTSNSTLRCGTVVGADAGILMYCGACQGTLARTFTAPSGFTEVEDSWANNGASYMSGCAGYKTWSGGTTGTIDASISGSMSLKQGFLVAIPALPTKAQILNSKVW